MECRGDRGVSLGNVETHDAAGIGCRREEGVTRERHEDSPHAALASPRRRVTYRWEGLCERRTSHRPSSVGLAPVPALVMNSVFVLVLVAVVVLAAP
jgi:hypothetical protein